MAFQLIAKLVKKALKLKATTSVPIDIMVSRSIEILISVPRLLLIMSIVAIAKPSIMLVMVIIGATSWTGIARFTRGELLRVRNLEYIEAAQSLGYSEFRTIFRHAIPNSLAPVLIAIAFGVAGAILTESFLSFLGIGVEAEVATWGKLLSLARKNFSAWWLALAPGFAIFITVTIYNLMGEGLTDALDPRLKQ
jgi:peptide/nickel transport system permease protein